MYLAGRHKGRLREYQGTPLQTQSEVPAINAVFFPRLQFVHNVCERTTEVTIYYLFPPNSLFQAFQTENCVTLIYYLKHIKTLFSNFEMFMVTEIF